jgi:hypothetical protein
MAGTTTNYGWTYPTSTDLVKDGATAIQTAVQDADTTLFTALNGAYPGLRFIKKQTIGSAVSSVSVTSAFSSTYENYKIIITGGVGSTSQANIGLQLTGSTTGYYQALQFVNYSTGVAAGAVSNNASSFQYVGNADVDNITLDLDIMSPFLAATTRISGAYVTSINAGPLNGSHSVKTSYSGFTLTPASGTITGGTIYVYGYGIN